MRNEILSLIMYGHYHTNSKDLFKYIEPHIPSIEWIQDDEINYRYMKQNNAVSEALDKTAELLYEKYIVDVDKSAKVGYTSIWNGNEITNSEWHNDLKEGPNICFLLYYSDIKDECGGKLEMRKKETGQVTGSITPQKYDIVMFSQELDWEHRVSPFLCGPMERITVNIGFNVKWI